MKTVVISKPVSAQKDADFLPQFTELLSSRTDRYLPTTDELDRILGGEPEDSLCTNTILERHCWFDEFLGAVNWWRMLSNLALEWNNPDSEYFRFGPNPVLWEHRQNLSAKLGAVLAAYGAAHQELSPYSSDWINKGLATVGMLKAYGLYVKEVRALAAKVWPGMSLDRLLKQ
jgi:hypothetical protein